MGDIAKLPYWGSDFPIDEDDPAPTPKMRFPFKPEFNKRISLARQEDAMKFECDIIVVGTNESLDAKGCFFERIVDTCGPEFKKATSLLAPLKVTETRIMPIPAGRLAARNVMMMMPPRYSDKYQSAAINSLNKTYLNALQVSVDNSYRKIVFTEIHDLENKFDASIAAAVVVRTIRRFFEHYASSVDNICLVLDGHGMDEYTKQMKLYFPRSGKEAITSDKALPADVGNEWGEMVNAARSIRISSLPGMGGDDDDYDDDEDQVPTVVGDDQKETMEYSQRQPDPDERSTQGVNDPHSVNYVPQGYVNGILARANSMDLSALEQAGFFISCGIDTMSQRNVLMFIGQNYVKPEVTRDKVMPYIAKVLDPVSFTPFTIVYVHCTQTNNADSMSWIHSIASTFPRRCLVNMRLAVLYPTFWLKTHLRLNRFGDLRPVDDISYYDNLAALFRVIGRDAIRLPEDIIRADLSVQSTSSASSGSSGKGPSAAAASEEDDRL